MQGSVVSALLYLRLRIATGWLRSRLRRLRQPKYLVGAVVGVAYLYFFLFRNVMDRRMPRGGGMPRGEGPPPEILSLLPDLGAAVLLAVVAVNWIVPRRRAGLTFSEAEISFLFPAPIARRTLLNYRLLCTLGALAVTALFMTIFTTGLAQAGSSAWLRGLGWWVLLATLSLHFTGTSFAVTRLLDRGVTSLARGAAGLVVLALAIGVPLFWTLSALPALTGQDVAGPAAVARYVDAALASGPLPWLLAVPRLLVAPILAADAREFVPALGPALLVLAAHYAWVLYSAVSFEEASLARAEKRATLKAAIRSGNLRLAKAKRAGDPFRLRDTGRPEVAFLWKNLLAMGRLFRPQTLLAAATAVVALSLWLSAAGLRGGQAAVTVVGLVALIFVVFLGPHFARHDLRADLQNADVLKTYPLDGARLVLGEMLAPMAVLTAIAWLALLALALSLPVPDLPPLVRAAGPLAVATAVPFVCALQLVVHNAISLLFPAWVHNVSSPGEHGLDVMGQRLLFLAGQILLFALGLLPALLGAGVAFLAAVWATQQPAIAAALALVVALTVLGVEIWAGVRWLGERFTRFDLSVELKP